MASSTSHSQRATVFIAASEIDSNLYYATKFIAPDPFIIWRLRGERILVMSDLEIDRAKSQSSVDRVLSYSEVEGRAKTQGIAEPGGGSRWVHILLREAGITQILVPANFPFWTCPQVSSLGYQLYPKTGPHSMKNEVVKTAEEVRSIEARPARQPNKAVAGRVRPGFGRALN